MGVDWKNFLLGFIMHLSSMHFLVRTVWLSYLEAVVLGPYADSFYCLRKS